jgi:uncharacterized protein
MQLKNFLETKRGAATELVLFFGIVLSMQQVSIVIPLLVVIAIASLKVRNLKIADLGFMKSDFIFKKIIDGIITSVLYFIMFQYFIDPLVSKITPAVLQPIFNIKGNIVKLMVWIIISWTLAAFYEEIIFRGYLINRLGNIIKGKLLSKIVIVILAAMAFGFAHHYQGIHGVISTGIFGLFQSVIYLSDSKKLTIPFISHGLFDSIGFVLLFSGLG